MLPEAIAAIAYQKRKSSFGQSRQSLRKYPHVAASLPIKSFIATLRHPDTLPENSAQSLPVCLFPLSTARFDDDALIQSAYRHGQCSG